MDEIHVLFSTVKSWLKTLFGISYRLLSCLYFLPHTKRDSSLPLLMVILPILEELCRSYCFHGGVISSSQFLLGLRSNHCRVSYILAVQQIFYLCMKQLSRIWDEVGVIVLQAITTISFTSFLWKDCRDPQGPPELASFMIWTVTPNK